MRSVRALRTGTIAAVIAWKLVALALLPAALCCRAVMVADGTAAPVCCEGGEHGAMCPMKRGRTEQAGAVEDHPRAAEDHPRAAENQPRMVGCNSLDDALLGLLNLTGFTPDAFDLAADPGHLDRVTDTRYAAASFAGAPSPPPPRA